MLEFTVIDTVTNEYPDLWEIATAEEWARHLIYCDMEGFAIAEDGGLLLLDECGGVAYCPTDRFKVVYTTDVMPESEVDEPIYTDELIYKLECLLCHATGNRLSKHTYDLRTMESAVTDYVEGAVMKPVQKQKPRLRGRFLRTSKRTWLYSVMLPCPLILEELVGRFLPNSKRNTRRNDMAFDIGTGLQRAYYDGYDDAKREVASEIMREFETLMSYHAFGDIDDKRLYMLFDKLKKKYTGGDTNVC